MTRRIAVSAALRGHRPRHPVMQLRQAERAAPADDLAAYFAERSAPADEWAPCVADLGPQRRCAAALGS